MRSCSWPRTRRATSTGANSSSTAGWLRSNGAREGETMSMVKIAVVTGSTRPGRNNEAVARWVHSLTKARKDAEFELVDIADYELPPLDEPFPASFGNYTHEHTKRWAAKIGAF